MPDALFHNYGGMTAGAGASLGIDKSELLIAQFLYCTVLQFERFGIACGILVCHQFDRLGTTISNDSSTSLTITSFLPLRDRLALIL